MTIKQYFWASMMMAIMLPVKTLAQKPYQDPNLPAEERARDLCKRLTLEEKVSLMMNTSPAIERLDVPAFQWWNEALHGVGRNGNATVFPITMAMASTFDDMLVADVFSAVSDEARIKNNQARRLGTQGKMYHNLSFWTPNINIFRDPRWGRGQETYGEDPYLTAKMGCSVVRGLQGPEGGKYQKLLACAKHFAVHSGPEWNRHRFNAENISLRDLHETYLYAFKALVQDAHVSEVMCAYNRYEGDPCCGSNRLLQQILRQDWGYKGLVTSDCGAIDDFWMNHGHHYLPGKTESTSKAVASGTDVECGGSYGSLLNGVKEGKVSEAVIDTSLCRLLTARFRLGDFDDPSLVEWTKVPDNRLCSPLHHALALDVARKSIVLLRNKEHILPLKIESPESLCIMGPNATDSTMMWGNYNGFPLHTITIAEGIQRIDSSAQIIPWQKDVQQQSEAAAGFTTVIFCGGINPRLEGEEMQVDEPGFKGGDRTSIELPQTQRDILATLHKAGKRVILVNCSGSAIGLEPEQETTDAILQAWYGGEAGGQAVGEVLFGRINPSGKLPVTFYKNVEQLPDFEDYNMAGHTYRYFQGKPLYPFGYGLSYSDFRYSKPVYRDGNLSLKVSNRSKVPGNETVLVFIKRVGDVDGPIKTLRAFQRVNVPPHSAVDVNIPLPESAFEWWDASTNTMRVLPGKYEIIVSHDPTDTKGITVVID